MALDDANVTPLPGGVPALRRKLAEGKLQPSVLLNLREGAE